jgi:alpha-tubulin N-acetyltransferase 1
MLNNEKVKPENLGYDKPSNKFLNFLEKHYNLTDYVPQNNNFVVFKNYFKKQEYKDYKENQTKSKSNIDLINLGTNYSTENLPKNSLG